MDVENSGWEQRLAQEMYALNVAAVNQRYNEQQEAPKIVYSPYPYTSRIAAWKALGCWLYQRILELANYYARVHGDVDVWYNAGVNNKTLIRRIEPYLLVQETDKAMRALAKALEDLLIKKL